MPVYCCVPQCTSNGTSGFHRFPADPERRIKWMEKTQTLYLRPKEQAKICRKHFQPSDLLVDFDGKCQLSPNAVPSLFLPAPLALNWDNWYHTYQSITTSPKKRRLKRIKLSNQEEEIISDDHIGSEIEVGSSTNDKPVLGPYIDIAYIRSLEEKISQQAKEKIELARKLRNTTRKLKRLQQKPKQCKLDDQQVLKYLREKKKYSATQIEFQEMQLRNTGRNPHGRRFKLKEKSMCLAMYKSGPRSYRFKENNNIMVLPSLSTLSRHSAKLMFRTGTNPAMFSFIKEKVKNWTETDLLCTLSFDETALKSRLEYSTTDDEIIGFIELAGIRRPIFATHALTFMVRGINSEFKQPVAHFYTHGLKAFELAELVILVLEAVLATGLNVIMSVSDQLGTNASAIHSLMKRDFPRTPGCLLKYKVSGKIIIHCYDAPHILKVIRNNLQVKDFKHFINERWNGSNIKKYGIEQLASWDDVKDLYELDRTGHHRLLPKITEEHIKPGKLKMKVCVATQVFSQTYGSVMMRCAARKQISAKSSATAELLLFFNDLYDSINGSGPVQMGSLKGSISEESDHFTFWEWALFMLAKMNYIDKVTGETNSRSTVINKIESTIKGYVEVTKICLNKNLKEVSLRNTDSDGLENFFGGVKFCCQISCTMTPRQYRSGYTTMILNNLMSPNSESSNCEPDNSVSLLNDVHDLIANHISNVNSDTTENVSSQSDDLYADIVFDPPFTNRELNILESEALSQSANLICSKIVDGSYCNDCQQNLQVENQSGLRYPSSQFIEIFNKIFEFVLQIVPAFAAEKYIKKLIIEETKKKYREEVERNEVIGCEEHNQEIVDKLFELTTCYAIQMFCKNINDLLTGKIAVLPPEPNDIQKLAREFRVKKTRIGKHSDIFVTQK